MISKRINVNKQDLSVVRLHVVVLDDVTVHVNKAQEIQAQRRRQPTHHPGQDKHKDYQLVTNDLIFRFPRKLLVK